MLACVNVSAQIGKNRVLRDVNFLVAPKECVCITGKSGSGKSVLFHLLIGEAAPSQGSVTIDNVDLQTLPAPVLQLYRQRLGVIFQEPLLLPWATVAEQLAYPLELKGLPDAEIVKAVKSILVTLKLGLKMHFLPSELSPGEARLLAIGRAVIASPMIIIADEPLQGLDEEQQAIALDLLQSAHANGQSILCLSQNPLLGTYLSARTLDLDTGAQIPAHKKHPSHHKNAAPTTEMQEPAQEEEAAIPVRSKKHASKEDEETPAKGKKKIRITQIHS